MRKGISQLAKGFTLIELLVVIAIVALLVAILLPVMGRARLQAKVTAVNAELRQIGMALEAYGLDNNSRYPPTRVDCMVGDHFYQLPTELVESKFLPAPGEDTFMAAGVEDRFNRGYTYQYRAVGTLIYNRTVTIGSGACLWVPDGFPDNEQEEGSDYADPEESPVSWVLYSQGPRFDLDRMREQKYPVPTDTWYDRQTRQGIIVRVRLANGRQVGSFERR